MRPNANALLLSTCLALGLPAAAQDAPEGMPIPEDTQDDLVSALTGGTFDVNLRLRAEVANIDGRRQSEAYTLRTRLGYTTRAFQGVQAAIQFEDNRAFDGDRYNAAGLNGQPTRTVIADPEDTELNQFWLSYDFAALDADVPVTAKVGRQRMIFDNARFVGNVGWRNLEQTFDAARVDFKPEGFEVTYAYLWGVNRIFGPDAGRDFDSDSHLLNASYTGLEGYRLTGFAYLLDFDNAPGASTQTFGLRAGGDHAFDDRFTLDYLASYAIQSDYVSNPASYTAHYAHAELGLAIDGPNRVGAGYELLSSDNGVGFATPLATGHAFNGFADTFLTTPAGGLQDYYLTAGTTLELERPVRLAASYHWFNGDAFGGNLGNELDVVASTKLSDNLSFLTKFAWYNGNGGFQDTTRLWFQLEFAF